MHGFLPKALGTGRLAWHGDTAAATCGIPIGWEDDPGRIPAACVAVGSFFAFCNRLQFAVQQKYFWRND